MTTRALAVATLLGCVGVACGGKSGGQETGDAAAGGAAASTGGAPSTGGALAGTGGAHASGGKPGAGGATPGAGGTPQGAGGTPGGGGPPPSGAIGSGAVACAGVAGGSCGPGQACCDRTSVPPTSCVATFGGCACYAHGACPVLGCDGPEDCPGAQCCMQIDVQQSILTTWCEPSCKLTEFLVCRTTADCGANGGGCSAYGAGLSVCN